MGVDEPERFFLLSEMTNQMDQDQMLQYVGMIAGVEGVTIAEHDRYSGSAILPSVLN